MLEEWKVWKIVGNYSWSKRVYEVSSLGRVRVNGKIKELKSYGSGYYVISSEFVHKIVAKLFIPNPENKAHVDHINTIKTDNRVENLRWVTIEENNNNPLTRKHISESRKKRGNYGKHRVYREDGTYYYK